MQKIQKIRENSNRNSFKWQKLQKILILKTSKCVGKFNEIPNMTNNAGIQIQKCQKMRELQIPKTSKKEGKFNISI